MDDRDRNSGTEQNEGLRAGGDVQTKGASKSSSSETEATTRAGGDVQTKGASRENNQGEPAESE
jgi:hypothetical protein